MVSGILDAYRVGMCDAPDINDGVPAEVGPLQKQVEALQQVVLGLVDEVRELTRKNGQLQHQLHLHLTHRYGARSEKLSSDQLLLFAQPEAVSDDAPEEPEPKPAEDEASGKQPSRRNGRKRLPARASQSRAMASGVHAG